MNGEPQKPCRCLETVREVPRQVPNIFVFFIGDLPLSLSLNFSYMWERTRIPECPEDNELPTAIEGLKGKRYESLAVGNPPRIQLKITCEETRRPLNSLGNAVRSPTNGP